MNNVLSLSAKEAREFFLKEESYCGLELPAYFEFGGLLRQLSNRIGNKNLSSFYSQNITPREVEGVNYRIVTNKDGKYAWRPLQLIHPALYVYLVHIITENNNWKYIKDRMNELMRSSGNIKCEGLPAVSTFYKKDKAAQIVHWSSEVEKKSVINSLEYDYLFLTDITDCYGSIYTHSIAWALHGKTKAKKEKNNKEMVGNMIDWQLQAMSYGQTNGIPQGSAVMDFLAEVVLCYVDSMLAEKINALKKSDYKIIRYRDDYRIFVNNPQIAEHIIKELTGILHDFGMKINLAKTISVNNVIQSSVKSDKLYWAINGREYDDTQSELYSIFIFSHEFPNSGMLVRLLSGFYDKILKLSKKDIRADIKVLISIVTDISYKNPRTYHVTSAILSKLIDFLPVREKERIMNKILNKFQKLPNTGVMQLWLQRITIKLSDEYEYSEKLCNKVMDTNVVIWNSDWLNVDLRNIVNSHNLINNDILKKLGAVISHDEVELFELSEYPF